jgi:Squalene-hopene cyclase C-terminal domain
MDSSRSTHGTPAEPKTADAASLAEGACVPYLLEAQNEDGGWGFSQGLESRVEPTSWALIALNEVSAGASGDQSISRGYSFLDRAQLADGSWPSAAGQTTGSWVTSLGCWAFLARGNTSEQLTRGVRWLSHDIPGDGRFWWRFIRAIMALTSKRRVNAQNEAYWGWSWTEGTASWVEPTAQALIVLRAAGVELSSGDLEPRQDRAEKMLYDRMCPGGGWNCGNPMVYGVPGEPLVGPTVWALLALRRQPGRRENQISLDWLTQNWMKIQSPGSLALACIGLESYGKQIPEIHEALRTLYAQGEFAWNVPVVAWTALAMTQKMTGKMNWLNLAISCKTN